MSKKNKEVGLLAMSGGVWAVPGVNEQPRIRLARWSVRETTKGRVFVGYNIDDQEGRVSTIIEGFDRDTCCGTTRSGRLYQLVGPPGSHPDADFVWSRVTKLDWRDVSIEYCGLAK
ncbi:hypothetical protein KOM00_14770 [Geomonas sp. Red69]|uniref:hypothetical protein n=1 Tax=Geomonas diazotrophica TaxID=2843197 RepID=UPI001C11F5A2|nr:hypothetical protein [Geomonas diazotrophica]MBU5637990.1 hypothetical protein [Geomonas diazotrophica]